MSKVLVDSNILVYLVDASDSGKHSSARNWLESNQNNLSHFFVSTQNLRECSAVLIKKSLVGKAKVVEAIQGFSGLFNVIQDSEDDILTALDLCERDFPFYDALLVSTMKRYGLNTVLTENTKHFKHVKAKSIF